MAPHSVTDIEPRTEDPIICLRDFFRLQAKFWFNYQAFPSQLKSATRPRGNGFFRRLRNIWFGHSKAITLS